MKFKKLLTQQQVIKKMDALKAERGNWETHWQEIADYILPRKNNVIKKQVPGEKKMQYILDNTGMLSNELLAGALHGLLTNPNATWFELTTGDYRLDTDDQVRKWLQKTSKDMHNVLNNSNFQTEVHELYMDLCGFGTACMYIEEDERDYVRFNAGFIANYYVEENSMGRVDRVYREWQWTADKIVEEFGLDNVGKKVQDSFKKMDDVKYCVIHAVYPRTMVGDMENGEFKYISQYLLKEDPNVTLRVGGFREFPYVVPRWSKATGESYGRSPGMNALPEVKVLNKMAETMLIGAQKVVDPPVQLPDDGFVLPIVTKPGGINYYRAGSNDYIKPVFNDTRMDFGFQAMQDRKVRVRESFYVDQLMLQQGPQMTATEVLQRTEEKMRLLGPMLGRQQSEFLRPLIDRVFDIMLNNGLIPKQEIPAALQGKKLDVRYSSLIAKSQRLADGQNIMRTFEAITPAAQADVSVLDNIDVDKVFRAIATVYGFPEEAIRPKKEVDQMRQGRAEAQAQMQQQAQEAQQTEQMAKLAPIMQQQV